MDWQQYRKFYASKHGSASLQTISVAYQAYKNGKTKKTSTKTSTKSSPHKLTGKKSLQLQEILKNLPKTRHHRIAALKSKCKIKEREEVLLLEVGRRLHLKKVMKDINLKKFAEIKHF